MIKLTKKRKEKLDNMLITYIVLSIAKMKTLKNHYSGIRNVNYCPLCHLAENNYECGNCPWITIMNQSCYLFYHNNQDRDSNVASAKTEYSNNPTWTKLRIKQLTDWIELYENYLIQRRKNKRR